GGGEGGGGGGAGAAAPGGPARPAEKPFEPSVGRGASLLANTPAAITVCQAWLAWLRGEAERTTFLAAQARGELDDGDWLLTSMCQLELALADRLRGRLDDAERGLAANLAGWRAAGKPSWAASVCDYLSLVPIAQGRLDPAPAPY